MFLCLELWGNYLSNKGDKNFTFSFIDGTNFVVLNFLSKVDVAYGPILIDR